MNRTKLKTYAPQARRYFIQAVTDRAAFYGLTANKIELITEKGDVAVIGGRAFPRSVADKRKTLEGRIARQSFEQTMEAMAYTWFNRFVAIRFMELHGYLDHGYRVLSHPEGKATPEILEHAEHVELPGLDKNIVIDLKLDGSKEAELYRLLLIAQCNALHTAMPFLFEQIDDETELLLPDNLLHSDSLIRKLVNEIDEEDWQAVEIIGWLYQFYISEKKDQVIGKVVKSEDIPAATQLFTPNWIVKYLVQNSLGRQWLATYPTSLLRQQMEYYIEPAEQTPEVQEQLKAITPESLNPEELTLLDPACGSGHILVEAYDLFKAIYQERGYRARDIPTLILQKNLFGLEIDDRAAQLAAFALLMKARADDRRIFASSVQPNVLSIQESKGLSAKALTEALNVPLAYGEKQGEKGNISPADAADLINLFEHGKTFGSLIQVPRTLADKLPAIGHRVRDVLAHGDLMTQPAAKVLMPLVEQAWLLSRQYDAVVANPPYMGGQYMNADLKYFARSVYPECKSDLFAIFVRRIERLVKQGKFMGVMTPFTWMFITSYEEFRNWILTEKYLTSLIQPEYHAFFESAYVPICAFTMQTEMIHGKGDFFNLSEFYGENIQAEKVLEAIRNPSCGWRYSASSNDFKRIPGTPIAYSATQRVLDAFIRGIPLVKIAEPKVGLQTGENDRFLRQWYEVSIERIGFNMQSREEALSSKARWFPYNKGGDFRKWYGNLETVVNWEDDGREIRTYGAEDGGRQKSRPQNADFYFKSGITWSRISSSYFGVRILEAGIVFDVNGCAIFPAEQYRDTILALLCSCVAPSFMSILNPTLTFQVGDVARIPTLLTDAIALQHITEKAVQLSKTDWCENETFWDFQISPMVDYDKETVGKAWLLHEERCWSRIKKLRDLEIENNQFWIRVYGLQEELSPEVPEDQITLARPDREEDIKRLISYAVGCMMGRYSLDKPGLNHERHEKHKKEERENLSCDSCISWSGARFEPDPDAIVPIMDTDWFPDDAVNRFVEFIGVAWPDPSPQPSSPRGEGALLEENLKFVADSLGPNRGEQSRETIRRYLAQGFFKDHLKTYKRRPIYWLFTSGKQRAFQCLVYLHRYHEGTLSRMRTEYVIPLQGKINARIEQLASEIQGATSTSHRKKLEKEQDTLRKQQTELQAFDEKLRHYADMRISLDLDDGVKVNYGKFGDLLAEVKAVCGKDED